MRWHCSKDVVSSKVYVICIIYMHVYKYLIIYIYTYVNTFIAGGRMCLLCSKDVVSSKVSTIHIICTICIYVYT